MTTLTPCVEFIDGKPHYFMEDCHTKEKSAILSYKQFEEWFSKQNA